MERATRILNAFTVVTLMVTAIYVVLTFSAVLSPAVETTLAGGSIVYGVIRFRRCEWIGVKRLATAFSERNPNRQ